MQITHRGSAGALSPWINDLTTSGFFFHIDHTHSDLKTKNRDGIAKNTSKQPSPTNRIIPQENRFHEPTKEEKGVSGKWEAHGKTVLFHLKRPIRKNGNKRYIQSELKPFSRIRHTFYFYELSQKQMERLLSAYDSLQCPADEEVRSRTLQTSTIPILQPSKAP